MSLTLARRGERSDFLFTENETNSERLFGGANASPYVKDAFHDYVVQGDTTAVNPDGHGTKAAAHYVFDDARGGRVVLRLRLRLPNGRSRGDTVRRGLRRHVRRAHDGSGRILCHEPNHDRSRPRTSGASRGRLSPDCSGRKQFYHYVVNDWLDGDPDQPPPPPKPTGRNSEWTHLFNRDMISMPDKWEYPWFAAWDLAFHMIAMCRVDREFAKEQLLLLLARMVHAPEWPDSRVRVRASAT